MDCSLACLIAAAAIRKPSFLRIDVVTMPCAMDGDIRLGGAYVVRGLKVLNEGAWNSSTAMWIPSADTPTTIGCSVRTGLEDVSDVDSITQYL